MSKRIFYIFIVAFIFITLFSCKNIAVIKKQTKNNNLIYKDLNEELNRQKKKIYTTDELITWIENTNKIFLENGLFRELIQYYGELAEKEKKGEFKSIYYFFISDIYWQNDIKDISILYLLKIDEKYYNISYNFKPLGYYLSKRIINSNSDFTLKEKMYKLLLNNYLDYIDEIYTLYELANMYKQNLEVTKFLQTADKILNNNSAVSQNVNLKKLRYDVLFLRSKKDWVYYDLGALIDNIEKYVKNPETIKYSYSKFGSKIDFKIRLFQESYFKNLSFRDIQIGKNWTRNIKFENNLEEFSNEDEAYLKSSNWGLWEFRTWYFYFKKVKYPYDPKFNNCWEWAGIYVGDPF